MVRWGVRVVPKVSGGFCTSVSCNSSDDSQTSIRGVSPEATAFCCPRADKTNKKDRPRRRTAVRLLPPEFLVSVDFKRLVECLKSLESTVAKWFASVDSKKVSRSLAFAIGVLRPTRVGQLTRSPALVILKIGRAHV